MIDGRRKRRWILGLAVVAASGGGCSTRFAPESIATRPIDPSPHIRNSDDYKRAVARESERLESSLAAPGSGERTRWLIHQMAKLPSAPSRAFARALVDTLRPYGWEAGFSIAPGGKRHMTYKELAQLDALTLLLMWHPEQKSPQASPGGLFPYDAGLDLLLTIAEASPSDTSAATTMADALFHGMDGDFQSLSQGLTKQSFHKLGALQQAVYRRLASTKRPLNLTWFLVLELDPELYLRIAMIAEKPSGHDMHDLGVSIAENCRRAQCMEMSDRTRTMLQDRLKAFPMPGSLEFLERLDSSAAFAHSAKPWIRQQIDDANGSGRPAGHGAGARQEIVSVTAGDHVEILGMWSGANPGEISIFLQITNDGQVKKKFVTFNLQKVDGQFRLTGDPLAENLPW